MARRKYIFSLFIGFLFLSFVIFMLAKANVFGIEDGIYTIIAPLQKVFFHSAQQQRMTTDLEKLQAENQELTRKLSDYTKLQQDNKALHDQFGTTDPAPQHLIAAAIVGAPGFIPGDENPEYLVIDKGKKQGIREGMPVVYKNILLGKVMQVTDSLSQVLLITSKTSSLAAKDQMSKALGIVRGQDGELLLENVILSEKLSVGDVVVTHGDVSLDGKGYPPDLLLGKISSVEKAQSALFQRASLAPLLDVTRLSQVFIISK